MKRSFVVTVLALGLALPAYADVTMKQTGSGKGMGMSGTTASTTYIKGNKMRTDTVMGNKTQTMIFDVDGQKLYMFEAGKKEADVYDMATFGADLSKSVDTANMKVSMTPNGQTKEIARQDRYRVRPRDHGPHGDGRQQGHDDGDDAVGADLDREGRARHQGLHQLLQDRR